MEGCRGDERERRWTIKMSVESERKCFTDHGDMWSPPPNPPFLQTVESEWSRHKRGYWENRMSVRSECKCFMLTFLQTAESEWTRHRREKMNKGDAMRSECKCLTIASSKSSNRPHSCNRVVTIHARLSREVERSECPWGRSASAWHVIESSNLPDCIRAISFARIMTVVMSRSFPASAVRTFTRDAWCMAWWTEVLYYHLQSNRQSPPMGTPPVSQPFDVLQFR